MASYYLLRSGCCNDLNITLCDEHLATRQAAGWVIAHYRGADSQPCKDCIDLGRALLVPHKAFEGHKPSVVGSSKAAPNPNGPQAQGTAVAKGNCCGKHG